MKYTPSELKVAVDATNEIHQHAKLDLDAARAILDDTGAESHHVRQTLVGALNNLKRKPKNHATNRRKTKRTLKGNK